MGEYRFDELEDAVDFIESRLNENYLWVVTIHRRNTQWLVKLA